MSFVIDGSLIPRNSQLPLGRFHGVIESATLEHFKDGRALIKVVTRITAPTSNEGMPNTENFFLGTEQDKEGADPETQKNCVGLKLFFNMIEACGYDRNGRYDLLLLLPSLAGRAYGFVTAAKPRKTDPNRIDHNVVKYGKTSEITPGLDAGSPQVAARPVGQNGLAKPVAQFTPATSLTPDLPAGFEIE